MKINIKPFHFTSLLNKGYSLDMIYLLELLFNGSDVDILCVESVKIAPLKASLLRKGLITEEGKVTVSGKEIIEFINKSGKALKKTKVVNTDFDNWWASYPATGDFEYRGVKFTGDRSYRVKKDDCRAKFETIINEGYTADEMINAIKLQVHRLKESSIKERMNKLKYLQNSFTYLHQRSFESFVDLVRSGVKAEEEKPKVVSGGIDI